MTRTKSWMSGNENEPSVYFPPPPAPPKSSRDRRLVVFVNAAYGHFVQCPGFLSLQDQNLVFPSYFKM